MPTYIQNGAFLGTTLIQRSAKSGKGKSVFVPLEGNADELKFPLYGGNVVNPFKGAAKLYAGDLAELRTDENGVNPKYFILKTFEVADAVSDSATVYIVRNGYRHVPFVGDVLMGEPDEIGGTRIAATVTSCVPTTYTVGGKKIDVWQLTMSANMTLAKGDIMVEAEEAGEDKAMLLKDINSVAPSDYDFIYDPSLTFGQQNDPNFTDARYFVSLALGGTMFTKKMSPLPKCVLALNKSKVNGWFKASWIK